MVTKPASHRLAIKPSVYGTDRWIDRANCSVVHGVPQVAKRTRDSTPRYALLLIRILVDTGRTNLVAKLNYLRPRRLSM